MRSDLIYYRQRRAAERAAAASAEDAKVRAIHHELARLYDERIKSIDLEHMRQLHLVSAA